MTILFYTGSLLVFVGTIWLAVLGFLTGRTVAEKIIWAIVNLVLEPLGGIIFFVIKRAGLIPLLLVVIGTVLMLIAYGSMVRGMIGTIPA
jgi:hypothetical protein